MILPNKIRSLTRKTNIQRMASSVTADKTFPPKNAVRQYNEQFENLESVDISQADDIVGREAKLASNRREP